MDLLARGQASGELRRDVSLRLLRSMVLGPMEHILWEVIAQDKPTDIDAVSADLVALLWSAVQAPGEELAALRRLRADVADALERAQPEQPGSRLRRALAYAWVAPVTLVGLALALVAVLGGAQAHWVDGQLRSRARTGCGRSGAGRTSATSARSRSAT